MRLRITILLITSFLFIKAPLFANADTTLHLTPSTFIPGVYKDFFTDNFNNIFLVTNNNQVKKINDKGDSIAVFNDVRRYGNLYTLDVSNPLKILVYYKDFATILILDRFLNIQNTIDLRQSNILQATAVAHSYDNNYWVFDQLDNKIKKIDDNGNMLLETADFRLLFSESVQPGRIIDNNGLLYLYDEHDGWYIFDYYGAYKLHIDAPGWKDVQVTGKYVTGHDSSMFYIANAETFLSRSYKTNIDFAATIKIYRIGNKAGFLETDGLHIFDIQ